MLTDFTSWDVRGLNLGVSLTTLTTGAAYWLCEGVYLLLPIRDPDHLLSTFVIN